MGDAAIVRGEEELRQTAHDDGKAKGREDLHHAGIGFRPDRKAHEKQINHGAEHEQCGCDQRRGQQRIEREEREQEERRIHRDHQEFAMGEIDHIHQAEDQREPDRDQAVKQPHQKAGSEALNNGLGCHSPWSPAPAFIRYFIGQTASATAACGGAMVTNLPPIYCSSTGSASLFWPMSSNLIRFHGMMVCSPAMSVATSASRILSPSVDLARLMASAITIRPMNYRDVRSLRSLPDFSLYMALILPTIGRLVARSSEKVPREITPSSLSPTASYSAFSEKPASCATMAFGL